MQTRIHAAAVLSYGLQTGGWPGRSKPEPYDMYSVCCVQSSGALLAEMSEPL
jgi:hypothetical protein